MFPVLLRQSFEPDSPAGKAGRIEVHRVSDHLNQEYRLQTAFCGLGDARKLLYLRRLAISRFEAFGKNPAYQISILRKL
jgi:hypothetical protein